MAGYFLRVLTLLLILTPLVRAQEPLPPPPLERPTAMDREGAPSDQPGRRGRDREGGSRRKMENAPHGEPEQFRENMERWKRMSPDDKGVMREMYRRRREVMDREIERAIEQSKLELTDEQRKEFKQRYMRRRHEIETKLREQLDQRRRVMIDKLIEELRQNFVSGAESSAEPAEQDPDEAPVIESLEE